MYRFPRFFRWYSSPFALSSTDEKVTNASPLGRCLLSCPITIVNSPFASRGTSSGAKKAAISSFVAYPSIWFHVSTVYGNPRSFNVVIRFSTIRCCSIVCSNRSRGFTPVFPCSASPRFPCFPVFLPPGMNSALFGFKADPVWIGSSLGSFAKWSPSFKLRSATGCSSVVANEASNGATSPSEKSSSASVSERGSAFCAGVR